ncbi:hypothetical protein CRG98_028501 [Punica granatum]|uniref:MULE transposase domain-containing protein n=1 Tax=Punica granatum TaxID=22663 RepID=A0A2I0J4G3_PUNGR|nr:hypothetical protein CRG98_028501 [Punica granatum]
MGLVPGLEVHEELRDFETNQDAHILYASVRNVREIEFYFIQNEEEIIVAELVNRVLQVVVSDEDDNEDDSEDEEQDEDACELEYDVFVGLNDRDLDDAWVPKQDGDEDDDCTDDDHDVGEGGGGAVVDKTVEAARDIEALGEVLVQEAREEARKKCGEGTNMAKSSSVRRAKWRACNALNRTTWEEPFYHEATDKFVEETEYHSKELRSLKGSDDESDKRPALFHENTKYGQVQLQLDMLFHSLQVFKEAVKDYTISIGREVVMKNNDKLKKLIPNHSCSRKLQNKQEDNKWIAEKLVNQLRRMPNMTAGNAYKYLSEVFSIKVGEWKIYNALRIVKKLAEGSEEKQYARLRDYRGDIIASNPGSSAVIGVNRLNLSFPTIFDRMYICFDASKRGLLAGCRPLIELDGCFLKDYYGGTLLVAVTQDLNHSFYVIAYGVVEQETKDSWSWFLRRLLEDIGDPGEHG